MLRNGLSASRWIGVQMLWSEGIAKDGSAADKVEGLRHWHAELSVYVDLLSALNICLRFSHTFD